MGLEIVAAGSVAWTHVGQTVTKRWPLWQNRCCTKIEVWSAKTYCSRKQLSPVMISLPELCTPSAWKAIVPASSLLILDKVKACFFPRAVIRQFAPDFNLAPSLVQEPSTSAWLSSTSRVTVSVSCALVSVRPFITWIFFTEGRRRKCLSFIMQVRCPSFTLYIQCISKRTLLENYFLYICT